MDVWRRWEHSTFTTVGARKRLKETQSKGRGEDGSMPAVVGRRRGDAGGIPAPPQQGEPETGPASLRPAEAHPAAKVPCQLAMRTSCTAGGCLVL